MRFLENRILAKKPDSGVREPVRNIEIAYECLFWLYYKGLMFKITKNYHFGAKPEAGQNLSGKNLGKNLAKFNSRSDSRCIR